MQRFRLIIRFDLLKHISTMLWAVLIVRYSIHHNSFFPLVFRQSIRSWTRLLFSANTWLEYQPFSNNILAGFGKDQNYYKKLKWVWLDQAWIDKAQKWPWERITWEESIKNWFIQEKALRNWGYLDALAHQELRWHGAEFSQGVVYTYNNFTIAFSLLLYHWIWIGIWIVNWWYV